MSDKTPMYNIPLYATKPRRRIPGTDFVAFTMHRSGDNTVREYTVFTLDGTAILGTAYYQSPRGFRTRGYSMKQSPLLSDETWPTLAAFAAEMARRLGIKPVEQAGD